MWNGFWGPFNIIIGTVNLTLYFVSPDPWWFNLFIGILCLVSGIVFISILDD